MSDWLLNGSRFPFDDADSQQFRFTAGRLTGVTNVITTNADVEGGMSGGPALDELGHVLGITSAGTTELLGLDNHDTKSFDANAMILRTTILSRPF